MWSQPGGMELLPSTLVNSLETIRCCFTALLHFVSSAAMHSHAMSMSMTTAFILWHACIFIMKSYYSKSGILCLYVTILFGRTESEHALLKNVQNWESLNMYIERSGLVPYC